MKEITKTDKTDCSTNKSEEYSFWENVTECSNPPKEHIINHKNNLTRLTKTKITSTNN